MPIPHSDRFSALRLGNIFTKTVAIYKYFWFLSILQIHAKTGNLHIDVWDIVIRMVANAWYPIHYFRLSFGKSDSLFDIVLDLQKLRISLLIQIRRHYSGAEKQLAKCRD